MGAHQSMAPLVFCGLYVSTLGEDIGPILAYVGPYPRRAQRTTLCPCASPMAFYKSLHTPSKKGVGSSRKERVALNHPHVTLLSFSFSLSRQSDVNDLTVGGAFLPISLRVTFCAGVEAKEGEFCIRRHLVSLCITNASSSSSSNPLFQK